MDPGKGCSFYRDGPVAHNSLVANASRRRTFPTSSPPIQNDEFMSLPNGSGYCNENEMMCSELSLQDPCDMYSNTVSPAYGQMNYEGDDCSFADPYVPPDDYQCADPQCADQCLENGMDSEYYGSDVDPGIYCKPPPVSPPCILRTPIHIPEPCSSRPCGAGDILPLNCKVRPIKYDRVSKTVPIDFEALDSSSPHTINKINEIIKNIKANTLLDEFVANIAKYTRDGGSIMKEAMASEVSSFKELMQEVYTVRTDNVSELLKQEQKQLTDKYDKLTKALIQKAEAGIQQIFQVIPDFDYYAYKDDPEVYLRSKLTRRTNNETTLKPGVSLHQKTWLIQEARKLECDNADKMMKLNQLMADLACLSDNLALTNKKLAAYNRQLENHAQCLRAKIAENDDYIDNLDNSLFGLTGAPPHLQGQSAFIHPDSVIQPVTSYYDYC